MYSIDQTVNYFEDIAHELKYVGHTVGVKTGAANKFLRFSDDEEEAAVVSGVGFPCLRLSKMPDGGVSGTNALLLDRLNLALEICDSVTKDDVAKQTEVHDLSRKAIMQLIARWQDKKLKGTCHELENYIDLKTISYNLFTRVNGTGYLSGTRMTFAVQSYVAKYDPTQWQI